MSVIKILATFVFVLTSFYVVNYNNHNTFTTKTPISFDKSHKKYKNKKRIESVPLPSNILSLQAIFILFLFFL